MLVMKMAEVWTKPLEKGVNCIVTFRNDIASTLFHIQSCDIGHLFEVGAPKVRCRFNFCKLFENLLVDSLPVTPRDNVNFSMTNYSFFNCINEQISSNIP